MPMAPNSIRDNVGVYQNRQTNLQKDDLILANDKGRFHASRPSGTRKTNAYVPSERGEPQTRLTLAFSGGQVHVNRRSTVQNGNSAYNQAGL